MANIFDTDWNTLMRDAQKKATQKREANFKAKFGDVKTKVKDLHIKLGKEDYKALQEAMQSDLDSFNYKQIIRLSLKLGMKKWAQENFDDYYE